MFRVVLSLVVMALWFPLPVFGQKSKSRPVLKPTPIKRMTFAAAQKLIEGVTEGNLQKQMTREIVTFTLTKLSGGQVIELYYSVTPNIPSSRVKVTTVPGYGVWYENEAVYQEAKRPRHALEGLLPDTTVFIEQVPQLVARLETRLRTKLDYSRASLKRLDSLVAHTQGALAPTELNERLFQEVLAYYGEVLRRALPYGEWKATTETYGKNYTHQVPGMRYLAKSVNLFKVLKPGTSVMSAFYDEKTRGASVTTAFDKDIAAAQ
ncbi:MAG: hypothetical protein HOP19_27355 [Acidobacteria bacterium]|nr:hypothetical protein [Acidobacteriota bacterium]